MAYVLDFERPLADLEAKIQELRAFSDSKDDIDLSPEIITLEAKAQVLKKSIFENLTPWQHAMLARHPDRPNSLEFIKHVFTDFVQLHGDRLFGEDAAIIGGIGRLQGIPVTVLAHVKGKDTKDNLKRNFGMPHPEGYRKAQRLMLQAEKFSRPVICLIDTPGAYCGIGAEERGQAEAIARNLYMMAELKTPIVSLVIGEGGSGGALALGVADRILMLEHAIYSVASPESAAAILFKDSGQAERAASAMGITAQRLKDLGVIDAIVPEPNGGAHRDLTATVNEMTNYFVDALEQLRHLSPAELVEKRYQKYRQLTTSHIVK